MRMHAGFSEPTPGIYLGGCHDRLTQTSFVQFLGDRPRLTLEATRVPRYKNVPIESVLCTSIYGDGGGIGSGERWTGVVYAMGGRHGMQHIYSGALG